MVRNGPLRNGLAAADSFGLEQADRRLRQSIVVGITDTAD